MRWDDRAGDGDVNRQSDSIGPHFWLQNLVGKVREQECSGISE